MIFTFTPADDQAKLDAEACFADLHASLAEVSKFYGGNLRWSDDGLVTKMANSVRLRVEANMVAIDVNKRGAGLDGTTRVQSASVAACAKMVSAIHSRRPTAIVQVGNITYQQKVPPPPKVTPAAVTPIAAGPGSTVPAATPYFTRTATPTQPTQPTGSGMSLWVPPESRLAQHRAQEDQAAIPPPPEPARDKGIHSMSDDEFHFLHGFC